MSLKTKLRVAILALVLTVVLVYSWLYVSLLTTKELEASYDLAGYVKEQIWQKYQEAVAEANSAGVTTAVTDTATIMQRTKRAIAVNDNLNLFLQSIPSYSYTAVDGAVVDQSGMIVAHSDSSMSFKQAPPRAALSTLLSAGVFDQLETVFGPERVYEVSQPMDLTIDGESYSFLTARVGVSTVLLRKTMKPHLYNALEVVGAVLGLTLVLGWSAAGFLLRPIDDINVSLDLMTKGQFDAVPPAPSPSGDELGVVASKLTLLGQQFRDVRENMAQLLHGIEEALLLFTPEGRAILASDKVQEFLNLTPGEILGRDAEEIFASQPALAALVTRSIHHSTPLLRREVAMEGDRRVAVSVQFITGLTPGVAVVSLRDVESVRRLESQMEMSNRLAAISRLTSGVAHEVRNPLNAIVLHLEALKGKLARGGHEISPAVAEHLDIIAREIYRLDRVVRTFLDFTRPVRLNLQETDFNGVVREVVGLAETEAGAQQVQIVFDPNGSTPLVRVDRDLIKQAILNVVLNGCQAMPEGGRLSLTEHVENGVVDLEVSDQGPGIGADVKEKIFDLYFTTREKGSGIGLPLAFRAFQLHNGSVEFDNRPEGGATFHLRLPLVEAPRSLT